MKNLALIGLLSLPLILSGCVDREQADAKLVKGCIAAVEAFLPEGDEVKEIYSKETRTHPTMGYGHREVALEVSISDGYHVRDETHACIFLEEFGFAKMSHRASIYQLNYEGRIIGQENYQIRGDLQDMTKLTNAVDAAMSGK